MKVILIGANNPEILRVVNACKKTNPFLDVIGFLDNDPDKIGKKIVGFPVLGDFSYLKDKTAVAELFREVSPKIAERPGGYTRILKLGNRIGDNADMCILELVDYNEAMLGGEAAKTKTTRRRRSTTKKKDETAPAGKAPKTPKAKEAVVKVV